ncbi:MAG: CPBP family intramembrane metalloprotease [Clostridiales bacterium]|nr:CPBP family intramembrane metalloprotease [Clostridiales bacterium]
MKYKNIFYIIMSAFLIILILHIVDNVLMVNYIEKVVIKLVLFLIIPFLYISFSKNNFMKGSIKEAIKHHQKKTIFFSLSIFIIILTAYFVFKDYINTQQLLIDLEEKYLITKETYWYYGLFIVFINSFLEEFFFRGYLFLNLRNLGFKKFAYLFSALSFAIYHKAVIGNWFDYRIFLLSFVGLFIGGLIFNYLDDLPNNIINGWIVHICADTAIIIIGFLIFATT